MTSKRKHYLKVQRNSDPLEPLRNRMLSEARKRLVTAQEWVAKKDVSWAMVNINSVVALLEAVRQL